MFFFICFFNSHSSTHSICSPLTKRTCARMNVTADPAGDGSHSHADEPHETIAFLRLQCESSFAMYRLMHLNRDRFSIDFVGLYYSHCEVEDYIKTIWYKTNLAISRKSRFFFIRCYKCRILFNYL